MKITMQQFQCLSICSKGRVKYIELKILKIREYFCNEVVSISKVSTAEQQADILTKPISREVFLKLWSAVLDPVYATMPS